MPKLVRDNIPQIITNQGKKPIFRVMDVDEYKKELAAKLVEESIEFQNDINLEEMADVLEVFDAIMKVYGFSEDELTRVRIKKNKERGAFNKMFFLEEIQDL